MATDVTPARYNIKVEETRYKAGVTEATAQKIAGSINHINEYQVQFFEFGFTFAIANSGSPTYNLFTTPKVISGVEPFKRASEVVGIQLVHNTSGSSGTTELDIKWASSNSGTFNTIFSTTPKVTSAAASNSQFDTFGVATTPAGCTVPVLSKTTFAAGDVLRCECLSLQAGTPNGFGMKIYFRPL